MIKVISSWSAGKDSCLALYKSIEQGLNVEYLLNFISIKNKRCCFHGIQSDLIKKQSEVIGIPVSQKEVSPDMENYEEEFKEAVTNLKEMSNIDGMVFGDIYLDEHKEWIERVCRDLDIIPYEPLWNIPPEKIFKEFADLGFKAVVVSCKADLFEEDFIGRIVNYDMLEFLKEKNICPCGENGEFHTFVVDGPIFKKRIEITKAKPILKDGFWKHWILDIKDWAIKDKAIPILESNK
jgi:uncharacterized protein (TIGR00290 family)